MNAIAMVVLVVGVITSLVGGGKIVIAAFEESTWWGLGVLFFPIVSPVRLAVARHARAQQELGGTYLPAPAGSARTRTMATTAHNQRSART